MKKLELKDLKPVFPGDKLLKKMLESHTYRDMNMTRFGRTGTHEFHKWEKENWN